MSAGIPSPSGIARSADPEPGADRIDVIKFLLIRIAGF